MPDKAIHLYVFPGYADWEPAHAVAELRRNGGYAVEVVSNTLDPVESMGGVKVLPTRLLSQVKVSEVAAWILPGGDAWETEEADPELIERLSDAKDAGVPVAAICASTVAIARSGLFRGRRHTSNGLRYLESQVPQYSDSANYVDDPAVRDRGLITASGLADVEFAREIMAELNVMSADDRALWTEIFRSGRLPAEPAQ